MLHMREQKHAKQFTGARCGFNLLLNEHQVGVPAHAPGHPWALYDHGVTAHHQHGGRKTSGVTDRSHAVNKSLLQFSVLVTGKTVRYGLYCGLSFIFRRGSRGWALGRASTPMGWSFTIQNALFNNIQAPVQHWAPTPGRNPVSATDFVDALNCNNDCEVR